jgi:hypothetical protein
MNLYIDDLERVIASAKLHESVNRKFGITPLCTMNVMDTNGNLLGAVEADQQGKTCFKMNSVGKK